LLRLLTHLGVVLVEIDFSQITFTIQVALIAFQDSPRCFGIEAERRKYQTIRPLALEHDAICELSSIVRIVELPEVGLPALEDGLKLVGIDFDRKKVAVWRR
jgi:hypothetical protein